MFFSWNSGYFEWKDFPEDDIMYPPWLGLKRP